MVNINTYKSSLLASGSNLAQIKKNQSDELIDKTFTNDVNYKRIYILTPDGWKYEDAKYQTHTTPSILKDNVDYYLQFRPKVHYPVGSYVIVPDDTSFDINTPPNPFDQKVADRTQWWIIVGKDDANAFVRYNILKCNWNFQWVYNGKIRSCFGCTRVASSYTSGIWTDEYSSSLDNITSAWLPDVYHVYQDKFEGLGMDDTRTVMYGIRFMISNNALDPKVYQVSKVVELSPNGLLKLTLKQDDYNEKRDNVDLRVCDYYSDTGDIAVDAPIHNIEDTDGSSTIHWLILNDNDELEYSDIINNTVSLKIGTESYFDVEFPKDNASPMWEIKLPDDPDNDVIYTEDERSYAVGLMKLSIYDDNQISIKPGKAKSLVGKKFELVVCDSEGVCPSSIYLEVI